MRFDLFVAIDFDGTIVEKDITDEVIKEFARPGWELAEEEWEKGVIGSRECLERQMALIEEPLDKVVKFVDRFEVDSTFPEFIAYLKKNHIPHGVVSDGFEAFSKRILSNAGLADTPVFANLLKEADGRLKAFFPNSKPGCPSGTCKCMVTSGIGNGAPVILIGDGRSDFCLGRKAGFVFAKRKLEVYCRENGIPHAAFKDFTDVSRYIKSFEYHITNRIRESAAAVKSL
ncbi:MAG: HAD-IB family phosphatase [Deltaproteobacteria bacterium]|nr:HAD-IB family phosphatase [Deltaproteobacteria bacterium]